MYKGIDFLAALMFSLLFISVAVSAVFAISAKVNYKRACKVRRKVEAKWCTPCTYCHPGVQNVISATMARMHMRYVGSATWKVIHRGDVGFVKFNNCPNCGRDLTEDKP